ncbi:hypothetical protein K443DRAFT_7405 [Laccaria amethystina LaAM-08-1]|uniref:Uncharacterized protein n=1 Tax=Laccaria amethystina LaAM-08-1 TaxID=1095629 RepID=A0A0C9XSU3_9AGAR|nr:hypothetical protein K443DRAFT_7405 [Laccaria amethystina LaAM-08-1]
MSSPTPLTTVLSLVAFPTLSAAYSWDLKANPQQCSNLTISISGSNGKPPYRVLITHIRHNHATMTTVDNGNMKTIMADHQVSQQWTTTTADHNDVKMTTTEDHDNNNRGQ